MRRELVNLKVKSLLKNRLTRPGDVVLMGRPVWSRNKGSVSFRSYFGQSYIPINFEVNLNEKYPKITKFDQTLKKMESPYTVNMTILQNLETLNSILRSTGKKIKLSLRHIINN